MLTCKHVFTLTLKQAVLSRRFRFALRLLRAISSFEGLLARPMLLQLALGKVVGQAMMPYLRTAGAFLNG